MLCLKCRNFEICRYASIMKDLDKKVDDIEVIEEAFAIDVRCKYFIEKQGSLFRMPTEPGIRLL